MADAVDDSSRETQALLSWANNFLKKNGVSVQSISDFSDGVSLVHLVETAFNGKLQSFNPNPRTVFHKLNNTSQVLEFLKTQGVTFVSVDSDMIVTGKTKALTIVLWSILRSLTLSGLKKALGDVGGKSGGGSSSANSIKQSLLAWCNSIIGEHSNGPAACAPALDFANDFRDGRKFCLIINKLAPNCIDLHQVVQNSAAANLTLAFRVAEEKLGVPSLLQVTDFTEAVGSGPDEQSIMDYVCLLLAAFQRQDHAAAAANLHEVEEKAAAREQSLKENMDALQQKLDQALGEMKSLQGKLNTSEYQVQEANSKLANATAELSQEKQRAQEELQQANARAQQELKDAQTRAQEELASERARAQQELKESQTRAEEALAAERARAQQELEQANTVAQAALAAETARAHEALASERARAQAESGAYQQQCDALERALSDLRAQHAALQHERDTLAQQLHSSRQEVADMVQQQVTRATAAAGSERIPTTSERHWHQLPEVPIMRPLIIQKDKTLAQFMMAWPNRLSLFKILKSGFFSDAELVRPYELRGDTMFYYKPDAPPPAEPKGEGKLRNYALIDLDALRQQAQNNVEDLAIRLEPHDPRNHKPFELSPPSHSPEDIQVIFDWAADINARMLMLRYLEERFQNGVFTGLSEFVDFIADHSRAEFKLVNQNAATELQEAVTFFQQALIARPYLSLVLSNVALALPTVLVLAQIITRNSSMHKLVLSHNRLGSDACNVLARSFTKNTSLSTLELDGNAIGDEGLATLAGALPNQPCLSRLTLSQTNISDVGVLALVEGLRASAAKQGNPHSFPLIDLSHNAIGDRGCVAIAELVKENHTIREIYLNHNLISDEGALALAETLKTAPWVSVVHLAGNNLSSRALKAFAEAMESTRQDLRLNLSDNLIGREGVRALIEVDQPIDFKGIEIARHIPASAPAAVFHPRSASCAF